MAKIIKLSALVALLNVCITTVGAAYPNQGSPLDTKNTQVNCDGRIYGPSDFQAADRGFKSLNGKPKSAKNIPKNHYTSRERGERYFYYPIGNGQSTDFAILTSSYMDVVDVVMKQRKGPDKPCSRSQIAAPKPKPAPEKSESSGPSQPPYGGGGPSQPLNSGGGLDFEYTPYSQFYSGPSNPGAGYPSQPFGGCPPQGCPPPQPYRDSYGYGGQPQQNNYGYGDSYGYGGQPQQNSYGYGYEEQQQNNNPYGDGTYTVVQECHDSQTACTVM